MIGARFYTQLDSIQIRNDVMENELAKVGLFRGNHTTSGLENPLLINEYVIKLQDEKINSKNINM